MRHPFADSHKLHSLLPCRSVGVTCHLYCERDASRDDGAFLPHTFTWLAQSFGAHVMIAENLADASAQALTHSQARSRTFLVPLGFDCDSFRAHLRNRLAEQWKIVTQQMNGSINALWLPVGSGTLATVFRAIVPLEIPIFAVDLRVLPSSDVRIQRVIDLPNVTLVEAPQKFCERARVAPPVPPNTHYDAKLWEFIQNRAQNRDVWWNVAR